MSTRGFSLRNWPKPEPPRRDLGSSIDDIFRQAEQAQRAQQHQQETENEPLSQLTRADLKTMTPAEINQARRDGQLGDLLRGGPPQPVLSPAERRIASLKLDGIEQATDAELKAMNRTEIVAAQREGRLTALLSGIKPTATTEGR
jgi:hypothetical protein